jgi:hypothetical protein
VDPLGLQPDRHLYRYAFGSPIGKDDPLGLDTVGCDRYPDRWETPCKLECCAAHDKCFDTHSCSEGAWSFNEPRTGCDRGTACQKCNKDIKDCFDKCGKSKKDDPQKPNYYCGKFGKFVRIPGDYRDYATAKKACECDYSTACPLPALPREKMHTPKTPSDW